MQITRAVEYGAMGLICLARRAPGQTVMVEEISQEEDAPPSFMSKIFQSLARAGLVRSVRGSGGGFTLARSAEQITLLEVFEAIEGKMALQRCLQSASSCERQEGCALCSVFEQAQDQVKDVFARTTIADLEKKHLPAGAARARAKAREATEALSIKN
ncbi:MAG: Rrf2 family transcriptional regulator [Verrucomicrobiales bacterium]|nr:Rrf2 family transcriptional regulator [Verrucomicrobiales bacterium]